MGSQAYWDFMIGGILSWDGQLLDDNMYTWDLESELLAYKHGKEASSYASFVASVAKMPSLSLEDRRKMAVNFVRSTANAPNIPWMDDRKCPYTGNSIITPSTMLNYPDGVFGGDTRSIPDAVGTVSPIASRTFYELVDEILREARWTAQNDIDSRSLQDDPCEQILIDGTDEHHLGIAYDRSYQQTWDPNPYYESILKWRQLNAWSSSSNNAYLVVFAVVSLACLGVGIVVTNRYHLCDRGRRRKLERESSFTLTASDASVADMELAPSQFRQFV